MIIKTPEIHVSDFRGFGMLIFTCSNTYLWNTASIQGYVCMDLGLHPTLA